MFLSLLSHILGAWFAFALPAYATYKAIARNPDADALQALAAYWVVIGAFLAFEHTFGLFLSWLPFYWELRTVFLLYVSLPQTQGSAYVYKTHLEPWLSQNEAEFDDAIASAQTNAVAFGRTRVAALVDLIWATLNKSGDAQASAPGGQLKGVWTASVLAALAPKGASETHVGNGAEQAQPYSAN